MQATSPVTATAASIKRTIPLAKSPKQFLSVYLRTSPEAVLTHEARLRLLPRLDEIVERLRGTPFERQFAEDRARVVSFMEGLRQPGGATLALFSSVEAKHWSAMWLPMAVDDRVRYRHGAAVMPLLDVIDELEPVAAVYVANDTARLIAIDAGRLASTAQVSGQVISQHKGLTKNEHDKALRQHVANLASRVEAFVGQHQAGRLFVAGTPEALGMLRDELSPAMRNRVAGEVRLPSYASDDAFAQAVLPEARKAEREAELRMVREVITRGEKHQGAVLGAAATLGAVARREVRTVFRAIDAAQTARYSPVSNLLLAPEDVRDPKTDIPTLVVPLEAELPAFAMTHGAGVEVVHGEAAALLAPYGGLAAILQTR